MSVLKPDRTLAIAFYTIAESWLNQQLQYDLWHAEKAANGSA